MRSLRQFFFFYEIISHAQKAAKTQKAQKRK